MTDLTELTIAGIRAGLAKREFSAVDLAQTYSAAIEAANPFLNAYIKPTPEVAVSMAENSDDRLARGRCWTS